MPERIARFLDELLPRSHRLPEIELLYAMMRDYPGRGGKRIRGRLVLASCAAHGGDPERAVPLAAGLELFQNWILVHDDIEDDSEERRGQPALHRLHGVPLALNAGDAMHVYMWQAVLGAGVPGAAGEFLEAIHTTAEGQHLDLAWVGGRRWDIAEADYLEMVRRKTARYTVVAPLRLGALAAGHPPDARFTEAGLDLGVAFQVRDDVLNLDGASPDYGKEALGDLFEAKRTLVLAHLLEHASPREHAFVVATLEKPRALKSSGEVGEVLELIRRHGSIEHAQAVADRHAARGLALLAAALEDVPDQSAAGHILETVRTLATRSA